MVQIINIENPSQQSTGYVLVQTQNLPSPNLEYQFVNPTTQVALFSLCLGNCSSIQKITWNVYSGQANSSLWILFNQTQNYFFKILQFNFGNSKLFIHFEMKQVTSALQFVINQPPEV